ncbi:NAD(P)/FAD-dependent oxidoreductase [Anaerobranca gottschalkii]|uniref:Sarcosine oxidase subunit alpha n=1 Tax=Anaerobranca gottschalkii DSM 13577 TaxID=1120990 RepID=A0A1H9Y9L7_9FIRM|nr:NAD(P)/FAD-dependent oxidoreductase [Anaerobranca gottschalkii]SES65125.1 sarcosine oxidase subunit alpha [Anaerobranca gottschalkii DSM 13577]
MKELDVLVIGGGPAGINAAQTLSDNGFTVLLVDEGHRLGGQLLKQTHKFFGSKEHFAGYRGIDIPGKFSLEKVEVLLKSTVVGLYNDQVATIVTEDKFYTKVKVKGIVVATGAQEKFLPFIGNDLPGVYGAGAVQTLMNSEGILPGKKVLMVGAGNIGLIVSYQLLQAGVEVVAVLDAAPQIGGYLVHASKIARAGVPILTSHTIVAAYGLDKVEEAEIAELDKNWNIVKGSNRKIEVDTICLSVGLSPVNDLLWHRGCEMVLIPELGGYVPKRNKFLETTVENLFVAGDVCGVEEASSAMVEGKLAGLALSRNLGCLGLEQEIDKTLNSLEILRKGEVGEKIRRGLRKLGGI